MGNEIAMASVPCQNFSEPYDLAKALKEGTIFPELNKPFYMGGDDNVRQKDVIAQNQRGKFCCK